MSKTEYPNKKLPVAELRLGDVVSLGDGDYMTATVIQVTEDEVTFFRPYVHTSDFSTSAGVIPYIGTETFKVYRQSKGREYHVYKREEIK